MRAARARAHCEPACLQSASLDLPLPPSGRLPAPPPPPCTSARTWRVVAVQRVAAAGVGPDAGEGDLAGGALLQQQAVLRVEQEHGEGAVQQPRRLLGRKPGGRGEAGALVGLRHSGCRRGGARQHPRAAAAAPPADPAPTRRHLCESYLFACPTMLSFSSTRMHSSLSISSCCVPLPARGDVAVSLLSTCLPCTLPALPLGKAIQARPQALHTHHPRLWPLLSWRSGAQGGGRALPLPPRTTAAAAGRELRRNSAAALPACASFEEWIAISLRRLAGLEGFV